MSPRLKIVVAKIIVLAAATVGVGFVVHEGWILYRMNPISFLWCTGFIALLCAACWAGWVLIDAEFRE